MSKKIALFVALALVVLIPGSFVGAAQYLPTSQDDAGTVVVSGSGHHNLYVGGGSVLINDPVGGDLFAAGASVNVAGAVEDDLFAAGGNVTIASPVGGDARLGGGNIVVNAPIGGDLLAAGGTVLISGETNIGGDFWAAGGMVSLNTDVAGDVKIGGGEVLINGRVDGTVSVRSEKLTFGPNAIVNGSIVYTGVNEAVVQAGAQVGQIEFSRMARAADSNTAGAFWLFVLIKFLALLAAALILYALLKKTARAMVELGYNKFWSNLGIGLVAGIATPVLSVVLMFTVVGMFAGVLLLALFVVASLVSVLYSFMLLGVVLRKWLFRKKDLKLTWLVVLGGVVAGTIIFFVPFVGGIILWVFCLTTFGAVVRSLLGARN